MANRHDKFIQPVEDIVLVSRPASSDPAVTAFRELSKPVPLRPAELTEVRRVAQALLAGLSEPSVRAQIEAAHIVGAPSSGVQLILLFETVRLGFKSEVAGLFHEHASTKIRPDCYRAIGQSGILLEVERGKTLANNMDLLDMWKCHICSAADYLFLVVPKRRPTAKGVSTVIFDRVCDRLEPLFRPPNCVNVEAAFVFGY